MVILCLQRRLFRGPQYAEEFINPISTGGGGAFHLQPSEWLRTPKQNKPLPWNLVTFNK